VAVEIIWSPRARLRLQEIQNHVARDKPGASDRLAIRIVNVVEALRSHPHLGRTGAQPGVRELVIGGTPYIVIYGVRGARVVIRTIWHGAQRK
jgi:toxin ParE1/3/4